MMKKYNKEKQGIIQLGKGFGLIVPEHSNSTEIMVSIGVLVQLLALGHKENGDNLETLLAMITEYVKGVYKGDFEKIKVVS